MALPIVELEEKIKAKRKELEEIFTEAGPEYDMSKIKKIDGDAGAKVEEIRRRNTELTELGKQYDTLADLNRINAANHAAASGLILPNQGLVLPGQQHMVEDGDPLRGKSIGEWFVDSDGYKGYTKARRSGPEAELNSKLIWPDVSSGRKATLDETAVPPESTRIPRIQPYAFRRPMVADMIPQGTTTNIAIVYLEEVSATNNVAAVGEGGQKPESAFTFEEKSSPVRKIATVLPITDELMQDVPAMRAYIDARLRLFLLIAEENQLVSGDGTGNNILGLYNIVGKQTQAKGTDPTPDAFYKAIVKIETVAFLEPSAIIMHPLDWQDIRLLRTTDGQYIWGNPSEAGPERLWGLPVSTTTAATQGTGIVAALDSATMMFRKGGISFSISDQHADFFIYNKLMLRIEERFAFVVFRPSGICTVTGI